MPKLTFATSSKRSIVTARRAFTLVESLIASVVLAIAAVGVLETLAACAQQAHAFDVETACNASARSLMEEIAARSFDPPATNDQPGFPIGNSQRDDYDDIEDYNGFADVIAASEVDANGNALQSLSFTRTVTIEYRTIPTSAGTPTRSAATGFAMVTVNVAPPSGSRAAPVSLCRVVSRFPH